MDDLLNDKVSLHDSKTFDQLFPPFATGNKKKFPLSQIDGSRGTVG